MSDVAVVADLAERVAESVERVIVGKRDQVDLVVTAVLAGGHVLLEDVPGTGKTMLARSLAVALGLEFRRIQCTPDLLPNDITGVSVFDPRDASFSFRPGPVFAGVVLADEINRATPRTQAALLEAMQEEQVTVDGSTHPLAPPFIVLATQNPIEFEGTFPLPEAQLDRFMISTSLGYPTDRQEASLVAGPPGRRALESVESVTGPSELLGAMGIVESVHLDRAVADYVVSLVAATREHEAVSLGASTRAALALGSAARARAAMQGRDYVLPDDVKALAVSVLAHRIVLEPDARLRRLTPARLILSIVDSSRVE